MFDTSRVEVRALLLCVSLILTPATAFSQEGMEVDAGDDVNLNLPGGVGSTATTTFNGIVRHAPDGEVAFLWFLESGPDSVIFSDEESNITDATFRRPGTYVITFRVTVGGSIASDDVIVTVGPEVIDLVVSKTRFRVASNGSPRSKLYFKMVGVNAGDRKLDLRPNDRFFVEFGGVFVGEFVHPPPEGDFMRMDVRSKARPTNPGGQTFDSANASFKRVRARYRSKGTGTLTFKACGGTFDQTLLPVPVDGQLTEGTITITVWVERLEYDSTVRFVYQHDIRVSVAPASSGHVNGRHVRR
jgi:hypothetical protein